jgi:hypothetical protein
MTTLQAPYRRNRGSIPGRSKDFYFLHRVQTGSGAHPASYLMKNGGTLLGVTREGREADHLSPSNVDVENDALIPPYVIKV